MSYKITKEDYATRIMPDLTCFELADKELNPHNQFLQTGVEIGIIGLLLLVALIFVGTSIARTNRSGLLLLVISALAFNSLFESMLQRQSGIVFFTFWICLLMIRNKPIRE